MKSSKRFWLDTAMKVVRCRGNNIFASCRRTLASTDTLCIMNRCRLCCFMGAPWPTRICLWMQVRTLARSCGAWLYCGFSNHRRKPLHCSRASSQLFRQGRQNRQPRLLRIDRLIISDRQRRLWQNFISWVVKRMILIYTRTLFLSMGRVRMAPHPLVTCAKYYQKISRIMLIH